MVAIILSFFFVFHVLIMDMFSLVFIYYLLGNVRCYKHTSIYLYRKSKHAAEVNLTIDNLVGRSLDFLMINIKINCCYYYISYHTRILLIKLG